MRRCIGLIVLALSASPALAHDPCIGTQIEVMEAARGRDSLDDAVRVAWQQSHAAYDDAVRRLDACHAALANAPVRTVGSGPQQAGQ